MVKRHDIVHRSGHDKDGSSISVLETDIDGLSKSIEAFAADGSNPNCRVCEKMNMTKL
jgi:hypothetical protein